MIYQTAEDRAREGWIAGAVASAFRCEICPFPPLTALDWYAARAGRIVAVLECKARTYASGDFDTTFLTVRKWLALTLAQAGLGVPGVYVVGFADGIRYCRVDQVDATSVGFVNRPNGAQTVRDAEPVIRVPMSQMRPIGGST